MLPPSAESELGKAAFPWKKPGKPPLFNNIVHLIPCSLILCSPGLEDEDEDEGLGFITEPGVCQKSRIHLLVPVLCSKLSPFPITFPLGTLCCQHLLGFSPSLASLASLRDLIQVCELCRIYGSASPWQLLGKSQSSCPVLDKPTGHSILCTEQVQHQEKVFFIPKKTIKIIPEQKDPHLQGCSVHTGAGKPQQHLGMWNVPGLECP